MSGTETPSQRIVASAQNTQVITDAKGRRITFRPMGILEQARLLKAIGPEQAENGPYVRLATIAASVVEIDGVPAPAPVNPQQVDAAIGRLGDDGYVALAVEADRLAEEARKEAAAAAG